MGCFLDEESDPGRLDSAEFLAGVSRLSGYPFEEAAFVWAFTEIFTPIESTLELIRGLNPVPPGPHLQHQSIDDRPDFAEAASRMGLHGLTYTDSVNLVRELEALGVRV